MSSPRRRIALALILAGVGLGGCVGKRNGSARAAVRRRAAAARARAGGGGGGMASDNPLLPARVRRLTNAEYAASVFALLGVDAEASVGGLSARRHPEARLHRQRRADRLLGAGRPARQHRPGRGRGGAPERAVRPPRALRRPRQRRRDLRARLHSVVRRQGLPAAAHRRGHRSAARPLPRRPPSRAGATTTGSIS